MGRAIPILVLLVALVAPPLALLCASSELPEVTMRSHHRSTDSGRLLARYPIGQRFHCEHDGLSRIEVALVPRVSPVIGELELVLYEEPGPGEPLGNPLRRTVRPVPSFGRRGGFVPFEFDPVADSAGRTFRFWITPTAAVRPATVSAWVRFHGREGTIVRWGDETLSGPVIEGKLVSPARDLRALAFAFRAVAPRLGDVWLEVWFDEPSGPPLRVARLTPEDETIRGWTFFAFEPIPDSLRREIHYRLHVPDHARVAAGRHGAAVSTLHGREEADPGPLRGMLRGTRVFTDRDLFFRAYAHRPPSSVLLALVRGRAPALFAAALLWLGAAVCVAAALVAALRPAPQEPTSAGGKDRERSDAPASMNEP